MRLGPPPPGFVNWTVRLLAEQTVTLNIVETVNDETRRRTLKKWLWYAIDCATGATLAYVFGRRRDAVFLELKTLLEPFRITRYYTDSWGAYQRHLDPDAHCPGKRYTQQIERKHLTLCTRIKRLVRKTICFSKSVQMHDILIGFINRYEFGIAV